MKKYDIIRSARFEKSYGRLSGQEKALTDEKLKLLSENPGHPSLRSKKLKGRPGLYGSSVNMDIRILWRREGDKIILLVNIGHHDILDRY